MIEEHYRQDRKMQVIWGCVEDQVLLTKALCQIIWPFEMFLLASHIPNKNEQMVRYNGYYSNVCRRRRKKQGITESDFVIKDDKYTKGANKSWSRLRLIKKIYEVDPLICPNVALKWGLLHLLKIIRKILDWLGIDEFRMDRPPPKRLAVADSFDEYACDDYVDSDCTDF